MAGIYIHVPYCKKKCNYCDFFSVGASQIDNRFADNILDELRLRYSLLIDKRVKTIYFGGGTPSLFPVSEVEKIILVLKQFFEVDSQAEITIEVNPDDVTTELAEGYKKIGINRLSIGVQSFNNDELEFLGRRHNSETAKNAIRIFRDAGFSNISIDLIYGLPGSNLEKWRRSLEIAFEQNIEHLSCYHLTYESGTPLTRKLNKGQVQAMDDEDSKKQFDLLRKFTLQAGYIHYEISNLAKPGYHSRHNSSYWLGNEYLGLGPSAHSYNKIRRWWNSPSIFKWQKDIEQGLLVPENELIDEVTRFNELLITRLRTIWGINLKDITNNFNVNINNHLRKKILPYIKNGIISLQNSTIVVEPEYYFISDSIVSDLLYV